MKTKILLLGLLLVIGCVSLQPTTPRTYEGAVVGTVLGGVVGALLDRHNPWRGGVIGGVIGAVAGGTLTEISARASREAVQANKPVEYRTEDGRGVYRAEPQDYNAETKCHKIHERVWEDGRLIKDQMREICEGTKYERAYSPSPVIVEERTAYVPAPSPLTIPAPPPMYVIPRTYVYFAPEIDVDIFFYQGYWYRPYREHWYRSGAYNGKWVYIAPNRVPPVLLNLPPDFRHVPPGHRHIPYGQVEKNWKAWEKEEHWERHGGKEWQGENWQHEEERGRGKGRYRD